MSLGNKGWKSRWLELLAIRDSMVSLFRALSQTKTRWLSPLVTLLLFLAFILALISSVPVIAPFIYPLF